MRAEGLGFMIEGKVIHFLKENERVRIYITANSLKSAAPRRLRRYLLLVRDDTSAGGKFAKIYIVKSL